MSGTGRLPTTLFALGLLFPATLPAAEGDKPAAAKTDKPAAAKTDKPAAQEGTPTGVTAVRSVEGISEYRLANGLQVLLFPDPSKPTVTVNLTVFVGSRHEGYGETGMAHLLEHMLFKGTPTHPKVPKVLQERGADFNGTTWLDRTNYYETLPASEANLEFAIGLEADRMVNSFVRKEDLASEMTVVRNEFERGENSPERILGQRMLSAAYEWHNYGKSTIGNRADIERVPIENLRAFYKKYYQPDNAMVVVAGAFDEGQALALVAKYFGGLPKPDRVLPFTYTEEPPQDGERSVLLRRVGKLALVGAVYHIPAGSDPSYPAVDVLESVLTAQPQGRLYKALVETKLAASVSGSAYALHDPGIVQFKAEVNSGNDPQTVLAKLLDTVEGVAASPVTPEEVGRAKARLLKQRELSANNSGEIAIELSEWASMGDWRLYFLYRDRLEAVTADDVNAAAKAYFTRNNRTVGLFLPTERPQTVPIPSPPADLLASIGDYQGRAVAALGEAFDVSPAEIEKRTERSKLPSGVKATLLEKKTRGDTVALRLNLRYGSVESLTGHATAADLLPRLMLRGTTTRTRQQIQDELDRLQAQVAAAGTPGVAVFTVKAKRDTLPEVLDLLGDVLRHPSLPAEELALLKQTEIANTESQLTEPQALATTTVRRAIAPYEKGDPRYMPTLPEKIAMHEAVTPQEVQALYETQLGGANGELSVVGSFDKAATVAAISKALADWTPRTKYVRPPQLVPKNLAGKSERIETPDKKNAVYFSATAFPLSNADPAYAPLTIGNFVLGGGSLSSRLGDRVRQQEGLSYGVGSGFSAQALDERAVMYLYAITNPQNVEKLTAVVAEEFAKLLKDGVTETELEAAKTGYLQQQYVGWAEDPELARVLAETSEQDRTMSYYADLDGQIRSLTPDAVSAALRKYVDPAKFVLVIAGDFAANEPAAEE